MMMRAKVGEGPQFDLLTLMKASLTTRFLRNGATDLIACYGNLLHPCFKGILLSQYENLFANTIEQFVGIVADCLTTSQEHPLMILRTLTHGLIVNSFGTFANADYSRLEIDDYEAIANVIFVD